MRPRKGLACSIRPPPQPPGMRMSATKVELSITAIFFYTTHVTVMSRVTLISCNQIVFLYLQRPGFRILSSLQVPQRRLVTAAAAAAATDLVTAAKTTFKLKLFSGRISLSKALFSALFSLRCLPNPQAVVFCFSLQL